MKTIVSALFLVFVFVTNINAWQIMPDTIVRLFEKELSHFPQEKMSIHTDRSVYLAGERVWFRVHVVDALTMVQANASRYVYVELTAPTGSLIKRIKIRPDDKGSFGGYLDIDEEQPEGYYTIRAYTQFMRNVGEDYFAHKSMFISTPAAQELKPHVVITEHGKDLKTRIYFSSETDNTDTIVPQQVLVFADGDPDGKGDHLKFRNGVAEYTFKEKEVNTSRTYLLQTIYNNKIAERYLSLPFDDSDFSVTFFPEGGTAVLSSQSKIAFKAIGTDGLSVDVEGEVKDEEGKVCTTFRSTHLGMGSFTLNCMPGKRYVAHCKTREGVEKLFELPVASEQAIAVNTLWRNDVLRVSLNRSPLNANRQDLTLVAQLRGLVLYVQPWDNSRRYIDFERDFFPAGIIHFILIDENRNILSERLVFSRQDNAVAAVTLNPDQSDYTPRQKVALDLTLKDVYGNPLEGNFSMSVVDKADVQPDTTSNIVSTLLLTSELKGYIEQPASYLKKDRKTEYNLDLLMMTQGWRRYNVPEILKGHTTETLPYPVELGDVVTGKVEGYFSASKGAYLSLLALNDSVIGTTVTKADTEGVFRFDGLEYPEDTKYIIQAQKSKGSRNVFIEIDSCRAFPQSDLKLLPPRLEMKVEHNYVQKMDMKYTIENGMRVYNLSEVLITARRKPVVETSSPYYSVSTSKVITSEEIEKGHFLSVLDIVRRLPGIIVSGTDVTYRGGTPMVLLDNAPTEVFSYDWLDVDNIADIFFSPPTTVGPIFGARAMSGAIVITTKKGFVQKNTLNKNMGIVTPLGYQQEVEFYSPVYDTKEKLESRSRDLRSTIYWNPSVVADAEGRAHVEFYAADSPVDYRVVVEGVCKNGMIISSSSSMLPE
ncbi:TonB-dependent receptor [Bacteroides ndongoniae]|uniref:TonB-dependent receptor n=1 Tax=Bacteroides ndongoniae TaxID=1903262 RepID=UPI0008D8FBFE|nr:MG2 domain-containing protein [Bacteroides ndongoniae]